MLDVFFFPFSSWKKRRLAHRLLKRSPCTSKQLNIDTTTYVDRFTKPEANPDTPLLDRIGVELFSPKLTNKKRYTARTYFNRRDTYFVLTYQDDDENIYVVAVIGFKLGFIKRNVLIEQIQAIQLSHQELRRSPNIQRAIREIITSILWEKLLIQILEDWIRNFGFRLCKIRKAIWNQYYEEGPFLEERLRKRNHRLKRHYDVAAERMKYHEASGFLRWFHRKYWVKPLAQI